MNFSKRYLFIDPSVRQADLLLAGLRADTRIHRLAVAGDPFAEIAAVLSGKSGIRQISILAHGAPGTIELSGQRIDSAALVEGLKLRGHREARVLTGEEELAPEIARIARPGDYVICLGAGSITQWAARLPAALAKLGGSSG